MNLFALGINHHTAPRELRERAVFVPDELPGALRALTSSGAADEAAILSTCNRTELYCGMEQSDIKTVLEWFCDYHKLNTKDLRPYLYQHPGPDAVKHVFRVASGLDSMILGEPQILGQMKDAFSLAHKAGTTGKILNRLFQQTFAVAKQVRTDTAIGTSAVSIAYAAATLAKQIFDNLSDQTVLLIGAGDTIELCARHLKDQGIGHMIVANRSLERAQVVAGNFDAEAILLAEMPTRLSDADIVIASTASQLPILGKGSVESALKIRKHRPMFMIDLAVPRDIEAEVNDLDDVYCYSIDDLRNVVQENVLSRQQAAREAEEIIDIKVVEFMNWIKSLDAVPTVRALRDATNAMRDAELTRAQRHLARGDDPEMVLAELAWALTNKFTHAPTDALKSADQDGNAGLLEAARKLFRLDDD